MTEKNRKDSFHTVALHHHNRTQRADVCTRRQKNYISLLYIFLQRSPCSTSSCFHAVAETRWQCVVARCICSTFEHAMSDTRSKCVVLPLTWNCCWDYQVSKPPFPSCSLSRDTFMSWNDDCPFGVKTAVLGLVYSSLGWVSGTALRLVGPVFRVSDVVSVLVFSEIDSCTSENIYDVRSFIFACLAEEEPPFSIPGFAASDFCSTDQCRSPLRIHTCTFTWVPRGAFFPWSASWTGHARTHNSVLLAQWMLEMW